MQLSPAGRFVFVAQWWCAVLLPLFIVIGRVALGASRGWIAIIGVIYAIPLILLLLTPPIITRYDREARTARSSRGAYVVASWVVWSALLIVGFTIVDAGDGTGHSVLTRWTGDRISSEVSLAVCGYAFIVALLAILAQIVCAAIGVHRSRAGAPPDTPPGAPPAGVDA